MVKRLIPLALPMALILTLVLRVAAIIALPQPVESDALSYLTMADHFAHRRAMQDQYGQFAFYSPGYAILLGIVFAVTGTSAKVGFAVNIGLALVTCVLTHRLALRLSNSATAAGLAALAYALWIPAVFGATLLYKENLSTPLLIAFLLCIVGLEKARSTVRMAGSAGLLFGAGLLTGASSIMTLAALPYALWKVRRTILAPSLACATGTLAIIAPWLLYTNSVVGAPVLTTNSGFNLYLGNNPAATGRFVNIAVTPVGDSWNAIRAEKGEVASAALLGEMARDWMATNPGRTAVLSLTKLGLFWVPNFPDAADFAENAKVAAARWIDVVQYCLIMAFGLWGLIAFRDRAGVQIAGVLIAAFWIVHGLTYIITRYRDPVMPILIALAALPLSAWIERRWVRL